MTIPINNKTSDTAAAITMTSIKSNWIEDYYNLNRSSLATDMIRIDISDHIESIGTGSCSNDGDDDGNNFIFRLPLKTGKSLNALPQESKTYKIFCRRDEPRIETYDCFGKPVTLECDGINRYYTSISCEYQKTPVCVLPSELPQLIKPHTNQSISFISNDICTTINYDKEYVICSCNLCKVREYNNRRKLQKSTIVGESENMEVVAVVEYVVKDAAYVLNEIELMWEAKTYNGIVSMILFYVAIWITITAIIIYIETLVRYYRREDEKTLSTIHPQSISTTTTTTN
jgi:hypothetical protein